MLSMKIRRRLSQRIKRFWTAQYATLTVLSIGAFLLYNHGYLKFRSNPAYVGPDSTKVYSDTWIIETHTRRIDGVRKDLILANGIYPGPEIDVNVGDRIEITVINRLEKEHASIHWHGISQKGSNHMDGAQGITQCGIPPGHNLTYSFIADKPGTFWWHSHHETQRADGLFGSLVVHDEQNQEYSIFKGSYDEEINIILTDYHFSPTSEVLDWYLSRASGGAEPSPDNGMINGKHIFDCNRLISDKYDCEPNLGRYSEFYFEKGKKYRLRIVNAAAMAQFDFSIDNHVLRLIEADSTEIEQKDVHYISIASGQRYSVIVEADQLEGDFFMRATMNDRCFNYKSLYLDSEIKAIVRYSNKMNKAIHKTREWLNEFTRRLDSPLAQKLPITTSWPDTIPDNYCTDMDDELLVPLKKQSVPSADIQVRLNAKIMKLNKRNLAPFGFFNHTSWRPAVGAPNLHVELGLVNASDTVFVPTVSGIKRNTEKWGGDQMIVDIPAGAVVELIVNNGDEMAHPFHLHGHDFWIIRSYGSSGRHGAWDPEVEQEYMLDNPVYRDTASVPRFGHSVFRFRADNPGIWAFHCHLLWHVESGMMMQFAEAGNEIDGSSLPPAMLEHCALERQLGEKMLKPLPGSEYDLL